MPFETIWTPLEKIRDLETKQSQKSQHTTAKLSRELNLIEEQDRTDPGRGVLPVST